MATAKKTKKGGRPNGKPKKLKEQLKANSVKAAKSMKQLSALQKRGAKEIADAKLERFPNKSLERKYKIEFTCPEFTCLCPVTGFPDFATIYIRYVPNKWCVELKSLKLYINKFRDQGEFHEHVTNKICNDFVQLLDPHEIEVVGDFNVRGNIKTIVTARHAKKKFEILD